MKPRKVQEKRNRWERWHPKSFALIGKETKKKDDPTAEIGDIIQERKLGNLRIYSNAIPCPECEVYFFKRTALANHLFYDHHYLSETVNKALKRVKEEEVETIWNKATCYYEAVLPREILPYPLSPEIDIRKPLEKGTKPPTAFERERHDREMEKWRRKRMKLVGKPILHRLPNGKFEAISGSIEEWVPQVLFNGKWCPAGEHDCLNWANLKCKKRVLKLIAIIREK